MSNYELAVVVSAKLEDEEREAKINKVKSLVEKFGGTITNVDEAGKKKLAYEIQKMNEGYYYFIGFETDNTDAPSQLGSQLRITDGVIRFMCVRP